MLILLAEQKYLIDPKTPSLPFDFLRFLRRRPNQRPAAYLTTSAIPRPSIIIDAKSSIRRTFFRPLRPFRQQEDTSLTRSQGFVLGDRGQEQGVRKKERADAKNRQNHTSLETVGLIKNGVGWMAELSLQDAARLTLGYWADHQGGAIIEPCIWPRIKHQNSCWPCFYEVFEWLCTFAINSG